MSFDLNWEGIIEPGALESLKTLLNVQLRGLDNGGMIEGLTIDELDLGSLPPELSIEDITDPSPIFAGVITSTFELPNDWVQFVLRIKHSGPLKIGLRGELVLNYPAPRFATLPVRILIRKVSLNGQWLLARLGSRTLLSLRKEKDTELDLVFDSEIGDPSRHSTTSSLITLLPRSYHDIIGLKNVGKVESFVQNIIIKLLDLLLVFPNYISLTD